MSMIHLQNLLGPRLRTLPILIVYLTDGCNSRCVMCDIWKSPRRNLSDDSLSRLASSIRPLHTRWVVLSGGEAMQHPGWPAAAARFRAEGARVILLTNGLYLRRQADDVIANIDEVVVSLDAGDAPTYAAIRGVDAFDAVLEGIARISAAGVPVTTRTTVQQANFRQLDGVIRAASAAGAQRISFLTIDVGNAVAFGPRFADGLAIPVLNAHEPPAGALSPAEADEFERLLESLFVTFAADFASGRIAEPPDKLRRMPAYFRGLASGEFPPVRCNAPHISAVVEVDGRLRPCYFLPEMAALNDANDLPAALNTPQALALRQAYQAGERAECARCVCPLHKGPRALLAL